jgi:hypothetical protein
MATYPVDEFFSDDTFLEDVEYLDANRDRISIIKAHVFMPYEATMLGAIGVENTKPLLMVRATDVPGVTHANHFIMRGNLYEIHEVQPDGTGIISIYLIRHGNS